MQYVHLFTQSLSLLQAASEHVIMRLNRSRVASPPVTTDSGLGMAARRSPAQLKNEPKLRARPAKSGLSVRGCFRQLQPIYTDVQLRLRKDKPRHRTLNRGNPMPFFCRIVALNRAL
jgi:hypothetical protein